MPSAFVDIFTRRAGWFACALLLLFVSLLVGCTDDRPDGVLSHSRMESLLYDYAQAKAMGGTHTDSTLYYTEYYVALALKKHGVTQAQMDSSLAYYSTRAEDLHEMYVNIGKRLERQQIKSKTTTTSYADMTDAKGDTVNIWTGPQAYMLHSLHNVKAEWSEAVADTIFRQGDELRLEFTPVWLTANVGPAIQHAPAEGYAVVAMVYADTILTTKTRFFLSGKQDVSTTIPRDGLQEVKGFFYQTNKYDAVPQLLFIMRPTLLRFKGSRPVSVPNPPAVPAVSPEVEPVTKDSVGLIDVPLSKLQNNVAKENAKEEQTPATQFKPASPASQKRLRDSLFEADRNRGRREALK